MIPDLKWMTHPPSLAQQHRSISLSTPAGGDDPLGLEMAVSDWAVIACHKKSGWGFFLIFFFYFGVRIQPKIVNRAFNQVLPHKGKIKEKKKNVIDYSLDIYANGYTVTLQLKINKKKKKHFHAMEPVG